MANQYYKSLGRAGLSYLHNLFSNFVIRNGIPAALNILLNRLFSYHIIRRITAQVDSDR